MMAMSASLVLSTPMAVAWQDRAGPLADQPLQAALAEATERLDEAGFDGHVSVAVNGEVVFAASLGPADPVSGVPYSLVTQTDIGSIAKMLTGLAASRLIAEGRLDPQSTLSDWFSNVPADKRDIALHQLMTHSAGFPPAIGDDHAPIERDAFVEQALASELMFAPGEQYAYSNVGFSLIAAIIEQVTGEPYEQYLRDSVLAPLGLADTGYERAVAPARGVRTQSGESVTDASWGGGRAHWHLIGNGGMLSTPLDLMILGSTVLNPPDDWAETFNVQVQPYLREGEGAQSYYGYGIVVENHPLYGEFFWHNGGNPHFSNHWRVLADAQAVIFATSNSRGVDPDAAVEVLTAAVFGQQIEISAPPAIDFDSPIDLPDTPEGRLAQSFLAAIRSPQPADWQSFITARTSPAFQAFAPMEQHVEMFERMHADMADAQVFMFDPGPQEMRLIVGGADMPLLQLMIGFAPGADGPVMNGLAIDGI
jgi:CubicO group peptidase (beta-lactamase class C family)